MAKWQRDISKERFWRQILRRWKRSKLSVREFCSEVGLAEHNFFSWKRVIAERDQEQRRSKKRRPPSFVPVQIVPDSPIETAIEIVVRDEHVLRVRRGFDRETLMQVLALLDGEGRRC